MEHLVFIIMLILCVSCKGVKTYTINEGEHDSGTHVEIVLKKDLNFFALFNNTAIYETDDPTNQGDINKLYGFSDCSSEHQTNSARFGWRWFNNQLEIHAYTYANGERKSKYIKAVSLNKSSQYKLKTIGDQYQFTVDEKVVTMNRGCNSDSYLKYKLYPYFGGDEVAPHDITVIIAE